MKSSYYTTPRTLAQATFHADCDPIERPQTDAWGRHGMGALVVLLVVAVVLVWITR